MHPIRLVVNDDLKRSRLTVFFRWLLVIPHGIWAFIWGIAVYTVAVFNFWATLIKGQAPQSLHNFIASYIRYTTRISAYYYLAADPFPPFGSSGSYPVDLEIDPPARQSRLKVFFRGFLAIPAFIVAAVLGWVAGIVVLLAWLYALFTGRMSPGLRDLMTYVLRYSGQTFSYAFLLTDRYPSLSEESS